MTTRKITAFLMCPAANGDASGGTPAASAASGGHIKKGAWVNAHEAALAGLAQVIPGPLSRALPYCYENKAKEGVEAEEGPKERGVHGSPLQDEMKATLDEREAHQKQDVRAPHPALIRSSATSAKQDHSEVLHGSGLGLLLGGALACAPWEYRAGLFACDAGELFKLGCVARRHEALPTPVIHRLFRDIQCDRYSDL